MSRRATRRIQIDVDCVDPASLAAFWCEVLAYEIQAPPSPHASWDAFSRTEAREDGEKWYRIIDPTDAGPAFLFHSVPEPKTVKNRLHVDVWVDGLDAEVRRLAAMGGSEVRRQLDEGFIVMTDPEGNEFCLCE